MALSSGLADRTGRGQSRSERLLELALESVLLTLVSSCAMEVPGMDVELGARNAKEYRVVAQPQARLTRKLFGEKGVLGSLEDLDLSGLEGDDAVTSFFNLIQGRVYEVLHVFIPDLMPEWEFNGYASQTAADEDQYDEEADNSPTHPQVLNAFKTAIQVNGLGWVKKLQNFFDIRQIQAETKLSLARLGTAMRDRLESGPTSQSSPQANGASDQTSSGESRPMSPLSSPPASSSSD